VYRAGLGTAGKRSNRIMLKGIAGAIAVLLTAAVVGIGCAEEMVGAPCTPETDKGDFNVALQGTTYSIETRSVQCETRICLTKTDQMFSPFDCKADPTIENCEDVQSKQSFCSCRCKDGDGHTYQSNPDKYDYLCECPPNTLCEEVLTKIEEAPVKIAGSYCIPKCIANGCPDVENEICTPSKNAEAPWNWKCKNK
jgi:hypothetical protein